MIGSNNTNELVVASASMKSSPFEDVAIVVRNYVDSLFCNDPLVRCILNQLTIVDNFHVVKSEKIWGRLVLSVDVLGVICAIGVLHQMLATVGGKRFHENNHLLGMLNSRVHHLIIKHLEQQRDRIAANCYAE
jgi:hypothetical protein